MGWLSFCSVDKQEWAPTQAHARTHAYLGAVDGRQPRAGGVGARLEQCLRLADEANGHPVVPLLPVRLREEAVAQRAVERPVVCVYARMHGRK